MTTPPAVPCPDCGDVPSVWGDADPLRLLGIPVRPYLYIACDCGATGPARRSRHAAVRAWNEGVTTLRCEEAKAEAARLLPERDEALESSRRWEAEVMLYAANRDYQRGKRVEAEAQVNDLAAALRQLERIATAVAGDAPTEARYGSLWSDLRRAAAEARTALATYYRRSE